MAQSQSTQPRRHGMIFLADVIFLLAIFFITKSLKLQTLDILMIGLVVLSLLLLSYDRFVAGDSGISRWLGAMQTVIAAIVALRFLVMFVGDMAALSSLFLYGSIILFFFIGLTGIWDLMTNRSTPSDPVAVKAASADEKSTAASDDEKTSE